VAQSAALNSERTAVSIDIRRVSASVLLLKSVGGGWAGPLPPQSANAPSGSTGRQPSGMAPDERLK
jgi:outer membrane protein TolC